MIDARKFREIRDGEENMLEARLVTTPEPDSSRYVTRAPLKRKTFTDALRAMGWKGSQAGFYDPANDFGAYVRVDKVCSRGHLWFIGRPPQALLDMFPCSLDAICVEPIVGTVRGVRFGYVFDNAKERRNVRQVGDDVVITRCGVQGMPDVKTVMVPSDIMRTPEFRRAFRTGSMDAILEPTDFGHGATHAVVALRSFWNSRHEPLVHRDGRRHDRPRSPEDMEILAEMGALPF